MTPDISDDAKDRVTILVVDDTPENLILFGEILKPLYQVRVANSAARALQLASSDRKPDLILLDVLMPEMNGYQVITMLRQNIETRDIPVIFVSALDDDEDETRGLELGAVDYITKPVRPAIVLARIQAQLELKTSRDRIQNQNVWLEMEVQRRMQENEEMQDIAFLALANLAETRDNETGNHILRTQGYIALLCDELAKLPKYAEQLNSSEIASSSHNRAM
jgi:putative two-component system response regulator